MRVSALIALSLAVSAPAQVIVTPGQDLQAAIDQAPDGGWVWVQGGGHYASVQIVNKSILIYANPPATIQTGQCATQTLFSGRAAAIEIQGTGRELVALWGIATYGELLGGGSCHAEAAPGIQADNIAGLYLFYSAIQADAMYLAWGEIEPAADALIADRVPDLHLFASWVKGGESGFTAEAGFYTVPRGGTGIVADGRVTLIDSIVEGGNGAEDCAPLYWPGANFRLPLSWGGIGGTGIAAQEIYHLRSAVIGGEGAKFWSWGPNHAQWIFLGQQPSGPGWTP